MDIRCYIIGHAWTGWRRYSTDPGHPVRLVADERWCKRCKRRQNSVLMDAVEA